MMTNAPSLGAVSIAWRTEENAHDENVWSLSTSRTRQTSVRPVREFDQSSDKKVQLVNTSYANLLFHSTDKDLGSDRGTPSPKTIPVSAIYWISALASRRPKLRPAV